MAGLALLAALTVLALPTREQTAPAIRPVTLAPLIVRGTGFVARERVRLVVRAGRSRPHVRNVVADRNGRFRARIGLLVAVEPCSGTLTVRATGSRGSRAAFQRRCRPVGRG
jgi:hypothetical protein